MKILETERLALRQISETDAEFILNLLNQPSFIKYIGDRKVRTLEQAREYISCRFVVSYEQHGFGLWLVERKTDQTAVGICGLVKRDTLPAPDIGFAFLPEFWSQGYAFESAKAVMDYAGEVLRIERILAITTKDNESSGRLLEKIGLKFERLSQFSYEEELKLFSN
jgi:RimJ/RimL family protein N-acetyltransferase